MAFSALYSRAAFVHCEESAARPAGGISILGEEGFKASTGLLEQTEQGDTLSENCMQHPEMEGTVAASLLASVDVSYWVLQGIKIHSSDVVDQSTQIAWDKYNKWICIRTLFATHMEYVPQYDIRCNVVSG